MSAVANFTVSWKDLNYAIQPKWPNLFRKEPIHILHNLSGHFRSGELVALMGPSGAGKTTLLECFTGQRTSGLSGTIRVSHSGGGSPRPLRMAIVPQNDHLFGMLTVREALKFASQFKTDKQSQGQIVDNLLDSLALNNCADIKIDQLSGGERKRVNVAQELVSRVEILFLDEPTSGLDALSAYTLMGHLKTVVENLASSERPVAMVATIHQPPTRVFHLFERVYFLSGRGHAIYDGHPSEMLPLVEGLAPSLACDSESNEADFITEIASGEHGGEILEAMESYLSGGRASRQAREEGKQLVNELLQTSVKDSNLLQDSIICFRRGLRINLDNRMFLFLRIFTYLWAGIVAVYVFNIEDTHDWGCPDWRRDKSMWTMHYITGEVQILPDLNSIIRKESFAQDSVLLTVFMGQGMYMQIITFSAALIWPTELRIMRYEVRNGWYRIGAYVLGRGLADLPIVLSLPFACYFIGHVLHGFEVTLYITAMMFLVIAIHAVAIEALGQLISIIIPGGTNCVAFGFIIAFIVQDTNEYLIKPEDINSPVLKQIARYNMANVALRAVVSILYSRSLTVDVDDGHCQCNWPMLDSDARPDWISCVTMPKPELFFTPDCQGIASDGTHWTLDGLFRNLTFSGKYDRQICLHHVDQYTLEELPYRTFAEESEVYLAQPRGYREFKPKIYHPAFMSMMGIDHGELPFLILQLIIWAIMLRLLCWIVLRIKK